MLQLLRPSCESVSFGKTRVFGPVAPNCAEGAVTSGIRSRQGKQYGLSGGRLFFNPGPLMFYPAPDLLLVTFYRPSLRPLGAEPQRMQQTSDMINVIVNTEVTLDKLGHAGARPQIGGKPTGLCSLDKQALQFLSGLRVQFRRAAGCGLCLNRLHSIFSVCRFPASDASSVYAHCFGYFDRLIALLKQLQGFPAAAFQLLRASMWPHRPPPAHSIGHYLCSCQ
jgi:hypothetical protein